MMNKEWGGRVENWRHTMPKMFFIPLGEISFEGFMTLEQLTPSEALTRTFQPLPTGTEWGAKWEYAWFRGKIQIPDSAKGERIALQADTGEESLIWINGVEVGAKGWSDRQITLTPCSTGGEVFDILIETYAGHGKRSGHGGPNPFGHETIPEPAKHQTKIGKSEFGIWDEELFQLWLDTETLAQLSEGLKDRESLRVAELDAVLKELTLIVDLELPRQEMLATVRLGRDLLKPFLEKRNGSTTPEMHCFGHAHIDIAWLWPLQETERKCGRTFSSQLSLMDQYLEYKFLQSQPHLYRMTQRQYPHLYERIKAAAKRGQWIADGAMWVESDTNLVSGESLIRQFMYGKRFFQEEFGIDSRLLWLPDVFGYSGALPQIMKGCGVDYFSTQKVLWLYTDGEPFPYNWFWWEGIDGTRTLSYIHNDYNAQTKPEATLLRWQERVQKDVFHRARLMPFGYGDGGGGPLREHLEYLRRQVDLEGAPKCKIEAPAQFFETMERDIATLEKLPTWRGEIYFQEHRGTYTTQALTKRLNRACEISLRETELWGAVAAVLQNHRFPMPEIEELWKGVLLNQFHDIIPGSSIARVYEEANALYKHVLFESKRLTAEFISVFLSPDSNALSVFNSLSWDRDAMVELPEGFSGAACVDGQPLRSQTIGGRTVVHLLKIPSMGWTTLKKCHAAPEVPNALVATKFSLENELMQLSFNARGEITRIFDKVNRREMAAGFCNTLRLYRDVPNKWDAWDVNSVYKKQPFELAGDAEIEIGEQGPLVASLRLVRKVNLSTVTQEIIIHTNGRRIDFRTMVDWQESHKMLKVNFPVQIHAEDALHEIQFGHLRRPTHTNRRSDESQFEVSNHKWTALVEEDRGAAVLNDCKYGVNVEKNSINLTLLRSPLAPDMRADKGMHEFTYSLYFWNGSSFLDSGLIRSAYELNVPIQTADGDAGERTLFQITPPNVMIETVKAAEDGSGDLIVRLYESARTATRAKLQTSLPFRSAKLVTMLEEGKLPVSFTDRMVEVDFAPFEIKTIRFSV